MSLNCRPGDLAIVVHSHAGNEGKIVRCLRLIPANLWEFPDGSTCFLPSWEVDQWLAGWMGEKVNKLQDRQLRPIRDPGDDAQDESFRWAPAPEKALA